MAEYPKINGSVLVVFRWWFGGGLVVPNAGSAKRRPQNGQNSMIAGMPTASTITSSGNPMRQ